MNSSSSFRIRPLTWTLLHLHDQLNGIVLDGSGLIVVDLASAVALGAGYPEAAGASVGFDEEGGGNDIIVCSMCKE